MEDSINVKCIDLYVNHENSDAECFDSDYYVSIAKVDFNNKLCDLCPYNDKFKNFSYTEFKEFIKNK